MDNTRNKPAITSCSSRAIPDDRTPSQRKEWTTYSEHGSGPPRCPDRGTTTSPTYTVQPARLSFHIQGVIFVRFHQCLSCLCPVCVYLLSLDPPTPAHLSPWKQSYVIKLFEQHPSCRCLVCLTLKTLHERRVTEDSGTPLVVTREKTAGVRERDARAADQRRRKKRNRMESASRVREERCLRENRDANSAAQRGHPRCSTRKVHKDCDTGERSRVAKGNRSPGANYLRDKKRPTRRTSGLDNSLCSARSGERTADRPPSGKKQTNSPEKTKRNEMKTKKVKVVSEEGEQDVRHSQPEGSPVFLRFCALQDDEELTTLSQSQLCPAQKKKRINKKSGQRTDPKITSSSTSPPLSPDDLSMKNRKLSSSFASDSSPSDCSIFGFSLPYTSQSVDLRDNSMMISPSNDDILISPHSVLRSSDGSSDQSVSPSASQSDCSVGQGSSPGQLTPPAGHLQSWTVGDLLWGWLTGHPWWPCVVCGDAEGFYQRKKAERGLPVSEYHVQYLGTEREWSWLRSTCLRAYEGKDVMQSWAQEAMEKAKGRHRGQKFSKIEKIEKLKEYFGPHLEQYFCAYSKSDTDCLLAVEEAEEASKLNSHQRVIHYVNDSGSFGQRRHQTCQPFSSPISIPSPNPSPCSSPESRFSSATDDWEFSGTDSGTHHPETPTTSRLCLTTEQLSASGQRACARYMKDLTDVEL